MLYHYDKINIQMYHVSNLIRSRFLNHMVHLGATNSISLVSLAGPSFETKGKKLLLSMQFQIVVWLEYYTKLSLNIYLKNSFVP